MCVFLISPVPIAEPLTSELIDTPVFYNLAPRPIKYRVSVPIPTHHSLPVLSESRILYLLACSEHRYTCSAQTPQIKRSTGSCCSAVRVQAVPVLDKNKMQICCSERTYGNRILLDCPLKLKLRQSYRPLPPCIREINPAAWSGQPRQCRPRLL